MDAELRIYLLGGFRAELEARPLAAEDWHRNRAKAVVKILALAPDHRLHREQLTEILWPGLTPEAADSNLRKAVHFARRVLGPTRLKTADDLVSLAEAGLWIDLDAFQAAADAGDSSRAIELYGGELLPEDRLEPWAESHRERTQARLAQVLWQRAAELEGAADVSGAAVQLERLLQEDPYNEPAHLTLMRLYASVGRRHRAVNLFQQLEKRLAEDLGVEPEPEARRLLQEILAGQVADVPAPASDTVISAALIEERKIVTSLVARISASTKPSAPATGSARSEIAKLVQLLEASDAWVQVSDDSILATFGVPRTREDDQERALLAGLEVARSLAGQPDLEIRVGICSGRVQVERRADRYEILGDVMDIATDLCRRTPAGTVLVGGPIRRSSNWHFRFGEALRVGLAGNRAAPQRRLVSVTPAARPRGRSEPELVGRDAEIEVLTGLFEEVVESGAPRFILISGSPGIGKSRLINEAEKAIRARSPTVRVLHGRSLESGQGLVHSALAEILRESCGVALDDSRPVVLAKFQDGLGEALEPLRLAGPDLATTVAALAATAAVTLPGSPLRAAEPWALAEEQTRAWSRFASALGAAGPTLIVIEDLHWAADQLLNTVGRLIARSIGPVLVLATARPQFLEDQAAFGAGNDRFSLISLRALTDRQSELLASTLQPRGGLWERHRRNLLDRAEGNPYFLQELMRHLEGSGGAGSAETSDPHPDLPDSLQVLLAARIDSLPSVAKRTLMEASVSGRAFWSGPLAASLGKAEVSGPLDELERRGFIVGRPVSTLAGQEEFIFNHALLREVAYASLPRLRRLHAHSALGHWLEELAAERREEVAELLAFHFSAALGEERDWDAARREQIRAKAFGYLLLAGTLARKQDAGEKAIELHSSALRLAVGPADRLRAVEELGDDNDSAFLGDAALALYEEAIGLAGSNSAAMARLCWKAARTMAMTPGSFGANPDPLRAERLIAEGLSRAPDGLARARLLVVRGAVARLFRGSEPFGQGERADPVPIEERITAVMEAMDLAQAGAQPELLASARSALGILYGVAGRYDQMEELAKAELEDMDDSLSSFEQADIVRRVAVNAINISGAFVEGLALARRCHRLSRDGNPHQIMHATWPILVALYQLGSWQEMEPILEEHLAAFNQDPALQCQFVRDGPVIGAVLSRQVGAGDQAAHLAALVGDPRRDPESVSAWQSRYAIVCGDAELALALSLPKVQEGRTYGPQHYAPLLDALIALEDWDRLRDHLPRARAAASGNATLLPFADRAEGLLGLAARDIGAATTSLRRARDGFDRLGVVFESAQLAELLASIEMPESRQHLLEDAAQTYERLGAEPHLARVRLELTSSRFSRS